MIDHTIKAELIASENDIGYTTYVFKNLGDNIPFGYKYFMLTRLPNWNHREIDIGEIGYVCFREIEAGKDSWYCQETGKMIPYNYTNIYFIKFVKEKLDSCNKDIII